MNITEKIDMYLGENTLAKIRNLKKRYDNDRNNPKIRKSLRMALDQVDWKSLSKKQEDELERIESAL